MSMVHISYGMKEPSSEHLRSECAIIAGMATATLPESRTPWQDYVDNYDRIRDTMARVLEADYPPSCWDRLPAGIAW
jgi:hypothetical protein